MTFDSVVDAARAIVSRHSSSVSPTTPTLSSPSAAASKGDGRLSSLADLCSDVDALQSVYSARSTTNAKAAWQQRNRTGVLRSAPSSTPSSKSLQHQVPAAASGTPASNQLSPSVLQTSSAPKIVVTHISVKETMQLRDVFDCFSVVESSTAYSDVVQTTVSRFLDIFSVTSLLHHARVVHALPPDQELRRIILRVAVANAQLVAKEVSSVACAPAVEPVLEFPTELTFSLFLQVVELVKRWAARDEDEDEAGRAFHYLSRNRKYIRAPDDAAIQQWLNGRGHALANFTAATSVSAGNAPLMSMPSLTTTSPGLLDLDGLETSLSGKLPGRTTPGTESFSGGGSAAAAAQVPPLSTKHLTEVLGTAGAKYDFDTIFASVDPHFDEHRGAKIDSRLFRWIGGQDDPDIIKAFVSLGGEEALSGTITVDKLISKCEAMQMTPQYIANFVAMVDPNQDGVVDFTEFLALLVRNRQELTGDRKGKLTDRTSQHSSAFRFSRDTAATGGAETAATAAGAFPFPRHKRFTKTDDSQPSARRPSLPSQGSAAPEDSDEDEGVADNHTAFQAKVHSVFEAADIIMIEDEEPAESFPANFDAHDNSESRSSRQRQEDEDSLENSGSDESPKARQSRLRKSIQETHLGIGLAGMLQGKQEKKDKHAPNIMERIDTAVKKGCDAIAQHRGKVAAAMHELERRRQRKYIRTDEGLVEGTRDNESAIVQRHKLRLQRAELLANQRPRQLPARVFALSAKAYKALETEVQHLAKAMGSDDRASYTAAAQTPRSAVESPPEILVECEKDRALQLKRSATPSDIVARLQGPHRTYSQQQRAIAGSAGAASSHRAAEAFSADASAGCPPRPPSVVTNCQTPVPTMRSQSVTIVEAPQQKPSLTDDYKKVKLEDPQSLWKLLDLNHRRSGRDQQELEGSAVANFAETAATRKVFARTIASHLALRLPYDDGDVEFGVTTPQTISNAYIISAPQPRHPTMSRPRTAGHQRAYPPSSGRPRSQLSTSPRPAPSASQSQHLAVGVAGGVAKPHRPQTAPAQRRPLSARSTARTVQLSKNTNRSPRTASLDPASDVAASRPASASAKERKLFGIGGVFDVEGDADDDDTQYV